jgi:hypothetical protein
VELQNITAQGRADNTAPLIKVNTDGTLKVKTGGTVTGNTNSTTSFTDICGGGIYADAGAALVLDGGTISDNTISTPKGAGGGGVHCLGTFTMYSGDVIDNRITNTAGAYGAGGAGVRVEGNGSFIMTGGTISGNIAHSTGYSSGGGVAVAGTVATFTMSGGSITNNTASATTTSWNQRGGGLCCYNSSAFINLGGSITGNWSIKGANPPEPNEIYFDT